MSDKSLLNCLIEYSRSDFYPFHMPGHKRLAQFPNPFTIDITEIDGFDNLHHAQGILKESMERTAHFYGADRTYYLVNGSSCGILSAICASTSFGGRILMSRNCHKSAYHGVFLNHLEVEYIYPQLIEDYGIQGGLLVSELEQLLIKNRDIQAVFVVSPTYDGVVSDIKGIAETVHRFGIPLIVDEAHGAHFRYSNVFPVSALELGADLVIQSLHKTLPCFTQTALLHVREGLVDVDKLQRYLQMFQSSSPSYVFMAGIEYGIEWSKEHVEEFHEFSCNLMRLREDLLKLKKLKLLGPEIRGQYGVFDYDCSKIVVSCKRTAITGVELENRLRDEYHLELEMCGADYVLAITSVMDRPEGLDRLRQAFLSIDRDLVCGRNDPGLNLYDGELSRIWDRPAKTVMPLYEGMDADREFIRIEDCAGRISSEFVYLYPPGIPLLAPGELVEKEQIRAILLYRQMKLPVQGLTDETAERIQVVKRMEKQNG